MIIALLVLAWMFVPGLLLLAMEALFPGVSVAPTSLISTVLVFVVPFVIWKYAAAADRQHMTGGQPGDRSAERFTTLTRKALVVRIAVLLALLIGLNLVGRSLRGDGPRWMLVTIGTVHGFAAVWMIWQVICMFFASPGAGSETNPERASAERAGTD